MYGVYEELERIPGAAQKAAKSRAEKHSEVLAEATRREQQIETRHNNAVESARKRHEEAHNELENRLKRAAQSASGKGALPSATASGTGRAPDFGQLQQLDMQLEGAIDDNRKLEFHLGQLKELLRAEQGQSAARKRDKLTFALLGAGALLSVIFGANIIGALLAIASAMVVQVRMTYWPSAYVFARSENFPSITYDARRRGSVAQVLAAWCLLGALFATATLSNILKNVHPFWNEQGLWRWMPSGELGTPGFGAYLSAISFWFAVVYAFVLLIAGYVRRGGR